MNIALFMAAYTDASTETQKQETPSCEVSEKKQTSQSQVEETDSDEDA